MDYGRVVIEHKPEHYISHGITVKIRVKPSSEAIAQSLQYEIEKLLEGNK